MFYCYVLTQISLVLVFQSHSKNLITDADIMQYFTEFKCEAKRSQAYRTCIFNEKICLSPT